MATSPTLPSDSAPFRAWLEAQPPDAVAGYCRDPATCPLAQYLYALGAPAPLVNTEGYALEWSPFHETVFTPLPSWARACMDAGDLRGYLGQALSVRQALEVLTSLALPPEGPPEGTP
jgi:hypothetical protein